MNAEDRKSSGCSFALRAACAVAVALVVASQTGCLRRRMTVRSNPPGAKVYVDEQEIGTTPVSTYFTYYAARKITLIKDGYRTETTYHRILPPWYEIPPIDLISENFWPYEVRDERVVDFQLVPQENVPLNELLGRAEALRGNARAGTISPLIPGQVNPLQPQPLPPPVGLPGQGLPDNAPLPHPLPPPQAGAGPIRGSNEPGAAPSLSTRALGPRSGLR